MNSLRLVIDTNIMLVSVAKSFRYRWIYDGLLFYKFELLITTEILMEYEEKFLEKYGVEFSGNRFNELLLNKNVVEITPSFNWNVITSDADDNKFVDCAVAGNADYIVSNDKHFEVLKRLNFPKVTVLTIYEFETLFREQFSL